MYAVWALQQQDTIRLSPLLAAIHELGFTRHTLARRSVCKFLCGHLLVTYQLRKSGRLHSLEQFILLISVIWNDKIRNVSEKATRVRDPRPRGTRPQWFVFFVFFWKKIISSCTPITYNDRGAENKIFYGICLRFRRSIPPFRNEAIISPDSRLTAPFKISTRKLVKFWQKRLINNYPLFLSSWHVAFLPLAWKTCSKFARNSPKISFFLNTERCHVRRTNKHCCCTRSYQTYDLKVAFRINSCKKRAGFNAWRK